MNANYILSDPFASQADEVKPPLFELDPAIWDMIDYDDIYKTYHCMLDAGIAHPPYLHFTLMISKKFFLRMYKPVCDERTYDEFRGRDFDAFFINYLAKDTGIRFDVGVKLRGEKIKWHNNSASNNAIEGIRDVGCRAYGVLLVLLATQNVEKITRANSDRASSHRAREDAKHFSTTTTIRVGKITETLRGASSGTGSTTRPHLRRGHIRNQRYGTRLSETKQIFIAPMFVRADENWIAEQKTYKVTA